MANTLPDTTLPMAEVFTSWQGEGRHAGRRCGFVRTGLCNLSCEWCDTAYTWDHTRHDVHAECPPMRTDEVRRRVESLGTSMVVLTGGEPLIHAKLWGTCALGQLLTATRSLEWHLETNGTLAPPPWLARRLTYATVSPKLTTGDPEARRLRPKALQWWVTAAHHHWADFKFVACNERDVAAVDEFVDRFDVPHDRVWVMPEGTTPDGLLALHRRLAPAIAERGYHTTTRLHTLLWGDERGR